MEWDKLFSQDRLARPRDTTSTGSSSARTEFYSDVDRLTFCPSFRRLARKTQVFPLAVNDHVHNRLTHSLEVSRVGRTLGTEIGTRICSDERFVNVRPTSVTPHDFGAVVEAASLAHDIGHPPFGHAGDKAFRHWFGTSRVAAKLKSRVSEKEFEDLRDFDGNAQGFRRISKLEKNAFAGGLNLTYTTLAAYIKYPNADNAPSAKRGYFQSEFAIVEDAARAVGLLRQGSGYCRHPLSFLVEAADDICYGLLDLEDAVEMGILPLKEVATLMLSALPKTVRSQFEPTEAERSHRIIFARMRGKIFRKAIEAVTSAFVKQYDEIMAGNCKEDLLDTAAKNGRIAARVVLDAKAKAKAEVFLYNDKVSLELASYGVIGRLLDEFMEAGMSFAEAYDQGGRIRIEPKWEALLEMLGDRRPQRGNEPPGEKWTHYQCARRVIDYVSGMTDGFAARVSDQLAGHVGART